MVEEKNMYQKYYVNWIVKIGNENEVITNKYLVGTCGNKILRMKYIIQRLELQWLEKAYGTSYHVMTTQWVH